MASMTLTHADQIYVGNGRAPNMQGGRRGVLLTPIVQVDLGAPAALSSTAVVNAQAVAGAGAVTMNGALVSGGVATLGGTYGRSVNALSSSASDTTQTVTIRGRDYYGVQMTETIALNGTGSVAGKKAFKYIDSVTASGVMVGNLSVGTSDRLGLPYRCDGKFDVLDLYCDAATDLASATVTAADTTSPATATTGDTRGTVTPNTATNGSRRYRLWMKVSGLASDLQSFGVPQYYA